MGMDVGAPEPIDDAGEDKVEENEEGMPSKDERLGVND